MKSITLFFLACIMLFVASCSNNNSPAPTEAFKTDARAKMINNIKNEETEMHKSMQLNNVTATLAIKAYDDFAKQFPDDSLAPDFLFKAGEITTAIHQYPQSLMYYQNITKNYPKYKLYDVSLYLQGFLLDNYLNDDIKAKVIYEEVIAKYPNSSYANDARAAITNLGKSDEDLIKEFKKKNGQK